VKKAVTAKTSVEQVPRPATQSKAKRTIVPLLSGSQGRDLFKITKYTPKEEYDFNPDILRTRKANHCAVDMSKTISYQAFNKHAPVSLLDYVSEASCTKPSPNFSLQLGRDNKMYPSTPVTATESERTLLKLQTRQQNRSYTEYSFMQDFATFKRDVVLSL
jgi:hypothetical protein